MVQEQLELMLLNLTKDEEAFKKFYKEGYFSYSDNKNYKGKVAIVNRALISLFEDANDELRVVATANFQDSGTFIYKIFGNKYSSSQFKKDPTILTNTARVHFRKKEETIQELNTIRKYCAEAEEKALAIRKISSVIGKFNTILVQSDNKISSQNVLVLLQDTLDRLSQSRHLNEVEQISDLDK